MAVHKQERIESKDKLTRAIENHYLHTTTDTILTITLFFFYCTESAPVSSEHLNSIRVRFVMDEIN